MYLAGKKKPGKTDSMGYGRKPQKAEMLTSTPIKLEQKKKQDAIEIWYA